MKACTLYVCMVGAVERCLYVCMVGAVERCLYVFHVYTV